MDQKLDHVLVLLNALAKQKTTPETRHAVNEQSRSDEVWHTATAKEKAGKRLSAKVKVTI
jgi:hypothetical protein